MEGGNEQKTLIDYAIKEETVRKEVLNAKILREIFSNLDHHVVTAKVGI